LCVATVDDELTPIEKKSAVIDVMTRSQSSSYPACNGREHRDDAMLGIVTRKNSHFFLARHVKAMVGHREKGRAGASGGCDKFPFSSARRAKVAHHQFSFSVTSSSSERPPKILVKALRSMRKSRD